MTGSPFRDECPGRQGPVPVLVLNHGYIDPDTYFPGKACRENTTTWPGRATSCCIPTIAVMSSDNDKNVDYELRLPYAVDTINAVKAVKSSNLKFLDKDRVGWLGRSMGGGVTLTALVVQPGLVDAAVIYASVSSLAADNWKQPTVGGSIQDQPADGADVRTARQIARILARPRRGLTSIG